MVIVLTYKCNLLCPHCIFSCDKNGGHMSMGTLKKAINFFLESGSKYLQISGGEPTEHPNFFRLMPKILDQTKSKEVNLLSNGKFLYDKQRSKRLANLQKKYRFMIQVTSVKNLYQDHDAVVDKYHQRYKLFKKELIYLVERITGIDGLGRAKGKDFSYLGPLYKRQYPTCINQFGIAKHPNIKTLKQLFNIIESNTQYNKCKPLIAPTGRINPGEYNKCISPGNVKDINCGKYLKFLKNNKACGECRI